MIKKHVLITLPEIHASGYARITEPQTVPGEVLSYGFQPQARTPDGSRVPAFVCWFNDEAHPQYTASTSVVAVPTGEDVPDSEHNYAETVVSSDGLFVLHFFDRYQSKLRSATISLAKPLEVKVA